MLHFIVQQRFRWHFKSKLSLKVFGDSYLYICIWYELLILIFIGLFHKVVLCTFTTLVVYYCLIDTSVKAAWCTFELEELVLWKQSQLRTIRINFRVAILEALAAYSFCAFMTFTF